MVRSISFLSEILFCSKRSKTVVTFFTRNFFDLKIRVAYDKETGRLIQRKIEATNKVISQHTQQFIQQFHSNEKKITPYNIQIRTLFRERISVKWTTAERLHKAQSKHQKSVVKYIVSPENTISIRVDENTKVENDSDEENRDVVNEEETELLSD